MSYELKTYLNSFKPEVKKRGYDEKFLVWVPEIDHSDNSWTLNWNIAGVYNSQEEAYVRLRDFL
jgi:hypothetical protein